MREEVLDAVGTSVRGLAGWAGRGSPAGSCLSLRTKIKSRVVYFHPPHITITKMALFSVFDFASHFPPHRIVRYYL